MKFNTSFWPFLAAILANILWGSTFLGSKVIIGYIPPFTSLFLRFLIAFVGLIIIGKWQKKSFEFYHFSKFKTELLILGCINYVFLYAAQLYGLKHISSSLSAAIMLLAPIFTILIDIVKFKSISAKDGISILSAFSGSYLILISNMNNNSECSLIQGILFTFVASFCLGYSVILVKNFKIKYEVKIKSSLSIFNLTLYSFGIAVIGFFPLMIFEIYETNKQINFNFNVLAWLLYLGILCSIVAFIMWNYSIIKNHILVTSISMYLKTPVAFLLGFIFLQENLTLNFYIGTLLILIPLIFNQIINSRSKKHV